MAIDLLVDDTIHHLDEDYKVIWISLAKNNGNPVFDTYNKSNGVARTIVPPGFTFNITRDV